MKLVVISVVRALCSIATVFSSVIKLKVDILRLCKCFIFGVKTSLPQFGVHNVFFLNSFLLRWLFGFGGFLFVCFLDGDHF